MTSYRAAASRHAVVFCVDDHWLPHAALAASQVHAASAGADIDIVICAPKGSTLPASLDHLNIRLCTLTVGDLFQGMKMHDPMVDEVYHGLTVPHAFAQDYDRVLLLDSDIAVEGGDFAALFNIDMRGYAIAAARDVPQWLKPNFHHENFREFGIGPFKYFNSGVMLIDLAQYRADDILQRCIAFGRANKPRLIYFDQQLLNCVLQGDWLEISPLWNWIGPHCTHHADLYAPAAIVHFAGPEKPWKDCKRKLPYRFVQAHVAFLRRHFPDRPHVDVPIFAHERFPPPLRHFWRDRTRLHRMRRFLRRFPDDLVAADAPRRRP